MVGEIFDPIEGVVKWPRSNTCEGIADIVGPALDSGALSFLFDESVYIVESASNDPGLSRSSSSGFSMISASVVEIPAGGGCWGGGRERLRDEI